MKANICTLLIILVYYGRKVFCCLATPGQTHIQCLHVLMQVQITYYGATESLLWLIMLVVVPLYVPRISLQVIL